VNDDTIKSACHPAIAVFDDTIVLVAWDNFMGPGFSIGVHFARSTDGGTTFGPSVLLNDTSGGESLNIFCPGIGVDSSGKVYVLYCNNPYPGGGFRLAVSEDTGRTFLHEESVRFGGLPTSLWVLPDGRLFAAWDVTREVCVTYRPSRGDTFYEWVSPVHGGGTFRSNPTVTANDEGRAFVAWQDSRNGGYSDIYAAAGDMTAIGEQSEPRQLRPVCRITPSPSRGPARIEFKLKMPGRAKLGVYDITGTQIRGLADSQLEAGTHQFSWDGRGMHGEEVPSGIYFVRLVAPDTDTSLKLQFFRN
jgi:hypothetical protein